MPTTRKIAVKPPLKRKPAAGTADSGTPKSATSAGASAVASACRRPNYLTVAVLCGCLMLSVVNLYIIVSATGHAAAMEESRNLTLDNFSRAVERQSELAALAEENRSLPEPEPAILWSAVRFADGEREAIRSNLIEPLLAWQALAGPKPAAILIERRHESSTNVAVRLFLESGEEYGFLWPEGGTAMEGLWLPPCGPNSPEGLEPASCPGDYLERFPKVTAALLEMDRE